MIELVAKVVERIAREEGVTVDQIRGRSRVRRIARVRHRVWHVVRSSTSFSYPELARMFGVDCSTVIMGCRRHELRINGGT